MKKKDIPQDEINLSIKNMREVYYVEDENGNYSTGLSTGWNPKKVALDLTIDRIHQQLKEIKEEITAKRLSPIYYFMIQQRMDVSILAGYMKKPRWIVKRHFKFKNFKKLKDSVLIKYASVFEIDIKQLTDFNE